MMGKELDKVSCNRVCVLLCGAVLPFSNGSTTVLLQIRLASKLCGRGLCQLGVVDLPALEGPRADVHGVGSVGRSPRHGHARVPLIAERIGPSAAGEPCDNITTASLQHCKKVHADQSAPPPTRLPKQSPNKRTTPSRNPRSWQTKPDAAAAVLMQSLPSGLQVDCRWIAGGVQSQSQSRTRRPGPGGGSSWCTEQARCNVNLRGNVRLVKLEIELYDWPLITRRTANATATSTRAAVTPTSAPVCTAVS